MKKAFAAILLFALMLSLVACGTSAVPAAAPVEAEPSIGDKMYEKYKTLIDSLEAEDYTAAIQEIAGMMPEPEESTIEITPENFWEYYEVDYLNTNRTKKNAEGDILKIDSTYSFGFRLKEKYETGEYYYILNENSKEIEIGVTADVVLKKIEEIDWQNGKLIIGNENYDDVESEIAQYFSNSPFTTLQTEFLNISTVALKKKLKQFLYIGEIYIELFT